MNHKKLLLQMLGLTLAIQIFVACSAPAATPTPIPPTATPTPTPVLPTTTPTPIPPTATTTPVPAMTATAEAFRAAIQATAVAAQPTLAVVQSQIGATARCQDIPADQFMLTSPVPLPAEIGQAWDGQAVIFRVPPGTVVRAPIDGSIRLGPWRITPDIDYMTITRGDKEILVGFPRGGYQVLLPGYNPNEYFHGADVERGAPIARLGGSTVEARPGGTVGLDTFNVIVEIQTPFQQGEGGEPIPLGVSSDLWYGGQPTACQDWPVEPTPAAIVQEATPTPRAAPAIANPPPYTGAIPAPVGRIAFLAETDDNSTEIFVVDLSDGTLEQVTHGEWVLDWRSLIGWHPDREHLFFYNREPELKDRKLVLLHPETGEAQILPNFPTSGAVWFNWSPDGSHLLWATRNALYVADAGNRAPRPIFGGSSDIAEPIWSPDGQQIAFVMQRQNTPSKEIYLIPVEGGNATRITDFYTAQPSRAPLSPEMLAWSPDGERIAFTLRSGQYPDQEVSLCTVALADQETACIDEIPVMIWGSFAWLPDGQHLVFQDGFEVYSLDIRSGEVLNLTHHPARDEIPDYAADQAISPDGQFLVFTSDRDYWRREIYVLYVPSGEVVARLTADFADQWDAVWSRR